MPRDRFLACAIATMLMLALSVADLTGAGPAAAQEHFATPSALPYVAAIHGPDHQSGGRRLLASGFSVGPAHLVTVAKPFFTADPETLQVEIAGCPGKIYRVAALALAGPDPQRSLLDDYAVIRVAPEFCRAALSLNMGIVAFADFEDRPLVYVGYAGIGADDGGTGFRTNSGHAQFSSDARPLGSLAFPGNPELGSGRIDVFDAGPHTLAPGGPLLIAGAAENPLAVGIRLCETADNLIYSLAVSREILDFVRRKVPRFDYKMDRMALATSNDPAHCGPAAENRRPGLHSGENQR